MLCIGDVGRGGAVIALRDEAREVASHRGALDNLGFGDAGGGGTVDAWREGAHDAESRNGALENVATFCRGRVFWGLAGSLSWRNCEVSDSLEPAVDL